MFTLKKSAISHLKEICGTYKNILIVADENTYGAAGEKTVSALKGKIIKKVIFMGEKILLPNEKAINTVTENYNAVKYAKDLRDKYTVLCFNYDFFGNEDFKQKN